MLALPKTGLSTIQLYKIVTSGILDSFVGMLKVEGFSLFSTAFFAHIASYSIASELSNDTKHGAIHAELREHTQLLWYHVKKRTRWDCSLPSSKLFRVRALGLELGNITLGDVFKMTG